MTSLHFARHLCLIAVAAVAPVALRAQAMDHGAMHKTDASQAMPMVVPPAQAAFATIADVVRKLKADSTTDWSKVNIEALRQHLIDMDDVVMRSAVTQTSIPGGASFDVTGTGKVTGAIRRMIGMHALALSMEGAYDAKATEIPRGVRLVATAKGPTNASAVAQLRGLGFAGLLTEGDHHAMHHMMVARGAKMMH
jgi:cytochrome c1